MAVIRKNFKSLTDPEKQNFINAVLALKANGKYNQYVKMHSDAMMSLTPPTSAGRNVAHQGPAFFPWHREFLRRFELDLQIEVPSVTLPYWNWAEDASLPDPTMAPIWNTDTTMGFVFMGGDGDPSDDDIVHTGPFSLDSGWIIADMNGNPDTSLARGGLQRQLGRLSNGSPPVLVAPTLPTQIDVDNALNETPYDNPPWDTTATPSFRNRFEGWQGPGPQLHNRVHLWIGGSMAPMTSPNDPIFFLHHCFVDLCWARWKCKHPDQDYPADGFITEGGIPIVGHNINDLMHPWEAEGTTIASVLDSRILGTLSSGSTGDEVILLQSCLIQLGYDLTPSGSDGIFGPVTEAAVRQFQIDNGLTSDGIVGPNTKDALCNNCPSKLSIIYSL